MKICLKDEPLVHKLSEKSNITISVKPNYHDALLNIQELLKPGIEYNIEITEANTRSTDANAYCWVLIGKLSKVLGIPSEEIYKEQVINMFTYRDILVRKCDFDGEKKDWEKDHLGRELKIIGDCKTDENYVWCRRYRSSSDYTKEEMSRFIDLIVFECQQQGIETKTPQELNKLKDKWQ